MGRSWPFLSNSYYSITSPLFPGADLPNKTPQERLELLYPSFRLVPECDMQAVLALDRHFGISLQLLGRNLRSEGDPAQWRHARKGLVGLHINVHIEMRCFAGGSFKKRLGKRITSHHRLHPLLQGLGEKRSFSGFPRRLVYCGEECGPATGPTSWSLRGGQRMVRERLRSRIHGLHR